MVNLIVVLLIAAMLFAALRYIYKAKKSGKKCIGCPDGGSCSAHKTDGQCSCHNNNL